MEVVIIINAIATVVLALVVFALIVRDVTSKDDDFELEESVDDLGDAVVELQDSLYTVNEILKLNLDILLDHKKAFESIFEKLEVKPVGSIAKGTARLEKVTKAKKVTKKK